MRPVQFFQFAVIALSCFSVDYVLLLNDDKFVMGLCSRIDNLAINGYADGIIAWGFIGIDFLEALTMQSSSIRAHDELTPFNKAYVSVYPEFICSLDHRDMAFFVKPAND